VYEALKWFAFAVVMKDQTDDDQSQDRRFIPIQEEAVFLESSTRASSVPPSSSSS